MKKQLFPKEIIENTVEVHQFKHSNKSKVIYGIILGMLIIALVALPFINITIYNTSQGLIRADKERIRIESSTSGRVSFHQLKNNLEVKKGDTLVVLHNLAIAKKLKNTQRRLKETKGFISDLLLLANPTTVSNKLQSIKYQQVQSCYQEKLSELSTRFQKIKVDYMRNQKLFEKGVIAKTVLNDSQLDYDLALHAIHQYKKQQKSTWHGQLIQYQNELKELEHNKLQLEESNSLSSIKAPVSGTLFIIKAIEIGSFITTGVQLAEISPQTDLIVECYVSPRDIGLLSTENKVNFQVSAYNYNQWGLATGKIITIGNDVQLINNTPMFKVLCQLHQEFLQLKNGFKGELKKGMLVNARFELMERTLFDLLYDKVDDWVNPSRHFSSTVLRSL